MWLSQKSATCVAFSEVSTACQAAAEVSRGSLHSAIRCIGSLLVAIATHDVMLSQKSPQPCGCCRSLLAAFHFGSLHSTVGCIGSLWRPVLCSATCVAFSEWLPAISWKHPRHTVVTEVSSDMRHVLQHVLPFQNGCLPSFGSLHDVQSLRKSSATCVAFCNMLCLFGMAACHLSEVPTTHGHCGSLQQHASRSATCVAFSELLPANFWKSPRRVVAAEVSQSHLGAFTKLRCHRKSPQPKWLLRKSPGHVPTSEVSRTHGRHGSLPIPFVCVCNIALSSEVSTARLAAAEVSWPRVAPQPGAWPRQPTSSCLD